jgi:hypothetical protein
MTTAPTKFGEVALPLHEQGYRPIPLRPGTKRPSEPGWSRLNDEPWTELKLRLATINHYNDACGITLPNDLVALDLDITEPCAAADAEALADQYLGTTPLRRVGMAPKIVLLFRSDGTVTSTKPHPVEVYCGSGQVAVFGFHQKAGRPYTWPVSSPLELAADSPEIPFITATDINAFLRAVEPVLTALRKQRGRGASGLGRDPGEQMGRMLRQQVPFPVAARLVLEGADAGGRHYAVRAVVSHGYNRGLDADRIARVVERAAPAELLNYVGDYVERCLRDFAPQHREGLRHE